MKRFRALAWRASVVALFLIIGLLVLKANESIDQLEFDSGKLSKTSLKHYHISFELFKW